MRVETVAGFCAAMALACAEAHSDGPPVVERVMVSPPEVAPGSRAIVAVVATDRLGGRLTYIWSLPEGWTVIGGADGPAITVEAPPRPAETAAALVTVRDL